MQRAALSLHAAGWLLRRCLCSEGAARPRDGSRTQPRTWESSGGGAVGV